MSELDIVKIEEKKQETPTVKSLFFDWDEDFKPGQFVMVWIPGLDEIPMAISRKEKEFVTVKKRGEATTALHQMDVGEKIGIRGPYGNNYSLKGEKILIVTGGCGGASLIQAVYDAKERGKEIKCCLGAGTEAELLFRDELDEKTDLRVVTDDGSAGREGFVTDIATEVLEEEEFDSVLTCGPEVMMKKVVDMCSEKNTSVQASLERYMKCGIGICDSCTIDGKQVCIDGPVFYGEELENMDEFGRFEREKDGRLKEL
ncbi:MAG: dihydroorotate dehydrogenase electron transfer subunit [Candidatus Thermoplasmatota archaeon]